METVCHIGFLGIQIFYCRYSFQGKYESHCHILHETVKPLLRNGRFSIFQDGGRPAILIFKSWKF